MDRCRCGLAYAKHTKRPPTLAIATTTGFTVLHSDVFSMLGGRVPAAVDLGVAKPSVWSISPWIVEASDIAGTSKLFDPSYKAPVVLLAASSFFCRSCMLKTISQANHRQQRTTYLSTWTRGTSVCTRCMLVIMAWPAWSCLCSVGKCLSALSSNARHSTVLIHKANTGSVTGHLI